MLAFHQDDTDCTAVFSGLPDQQYTITCPKGRAIIVTDALDNGVWFFDFRMVH